jgi:hypothetical protein
LRYRPHQLQPRREAVVIGLGDVRVVAGVADRDGRNRFAEIM